MAFLGKEKKMAFEEGSKTVRMVGGPINFYEDYTTTNLYVERPLGGLVTSITLTNDSATDTVSISFDGATAEADLKPGEPLTLNTAARNKFYICGVAGGDSVRIWGW